MSTQAHSLGLNNLTDMVTGMELDIDHDNPHWPIYNQTSHSNLLVYQDDWVYTRDDWSGGWAEDVQERGWMRRCSDRILMAIDAFLLIGTVLLPLLIGYMLPVDGEDPDPEWWIEFS
ncbi:hypothetical protein PtA15_7A613 [Puccinia triticina]|uniref:Uncharacterized protein n=1 Tax=Puccinia triticina TaxID=208348 RepID=A0ABY7CNY5_9BASI|nr:uncharacterized protein PtA15_7A613 [Puccinia triticina]WAQ86884.1 hypothetical protein PtA15_7A613 [Puccinia triticina]